MSLLTKPKRTVKYIGTKKFSLDTSRRHVRDNRVVYYRDYGDYPGKVIMKYYLGSRSTGITYMK
jgi:hypothetical protein